MNKFREKEAKLLSSLSVKIRASIEAIKRDETANLVAIAQSDDYVSLTLQDDTPRGVVRVALVFDTESKDLKQWTLTEPSSNELTFSLCP